MAVSTEPGIRWGAIAITALCALATLAAVDAALHAVAPPVVLREIDDSVAEYRGADPTVLVLGSSHARSFVVMGQELARRTGDRERMLAVPVEWGKFSAYRWVLENRLLPLVDEADGGAKVRPSLRRALIVTEWWDSTTLDPGTGRIDMNLPARAWRWSDFLADLWKDGLTPYNQNFLQKVWREATPWSTLTQDRGHENVTRNLKALAAAPDAAAEEASRQRRLKGWQQMVEAGDGALLEAGQVAALEAIVAALQQRGVETTILLYPRMPGTLTATAKATTLRHFSDRMAAFAAAHGTGFVDLTLANPLTDADFADDFDHILPDGNRRLAAWALDGDLRFLAAPAGAAGATDGTGPARAATAGGAP
jgi:hypothetical protein